MQNATWKNIDINMYVKINEISATTTIAANESAKYNINSFKNKHKGCINL